jgi:hypothetical protein
MYIILIHVFITYKLFFHHLLWPFQLGIIELVSGIILIYKCPSVCPTSNCIFTPFVPFMLFLLILCLYFLNIIYPSMPVLFLKYSIFSHFQIFYSIFKTGNKDIYNSFLQNFNWKIVSWPYHALFKWLPYQWKFLKIIPGSFITYWKIGKLTITSKKLLCSYYKGDGVIRNQVSLSVILGTFRE